MRGWSYELAVAFWRSLRWPKSRNKQSPFELPHRYRNALARLANVFFRKLRTKPEYHDAHCALNKCHHNVRLRTIFLQSFAAIVQTWWQSEFFSWMKSKLLSTLQAERIKQVICQWAAIEKAKKDGKTTMQKTPGSWMSRKKLRNSSVISACFIWDS